MTWILPDTCTVMRHTVHKNKNSWMNKLDMEQSHTDRKGVGKALNSKQTIPVQVELDL